MLYYIYRTILYKLRYYYTCHLTLTYPNHLEYIVIDSNYNYNCNCISLA